jgi:8-oxo-dGTP pyrophosphatase MutT (NUDIX family)
VLVALFEDDGEARVILTRRSAELRNHRGEVAFPGGRLDEGENTVEGALREAAEEVDLDPALVEIVGELAPLSTMSSAAAITPVVGVMAARPALRPNPTEVDRVFDVGLAELLSEDVFVEELWSTPTWSERPMFFFHVADETVWGATARILYELLILITDADANPGE